MNMTVKELIEELKKYNENDIVELGCDGGESVCGSWAEADLSIGKNIIMSVS